MGAFLAKLARRRRFTQSCTLVKVRLPVTVSQEQQGAGDRNVLRQSSATHVTQRHASRILAERRYTKSSAELSCLFQSGVSSSKEERQDEAGHRHVDAERVAGVLHLQN